MTGSTETIRLARARARILVIDDEPMVLTVMRRILGDRYDVTTLDGAEDALELVRAGRRFELILCDLMMPHMGGADFFQELERSFPEVAPRVVFLSGGALTASARQLLARLPNIRLEKPFALQQIRSLVEQLTALGDEPAQE